MSAQNATAKTGPSHEAERGTGQVTRPPSDLRRLTFEEICRLADRKGVRRTAVENFLCSMQPYGSYAAEGNLYRDAQIYGWNSATQNAIQAGIRKATVR